ncbi:MAG TPA: flagellar motor protein [Thermomicrobiales bacterium]|nr:flagellar motor protein [Thermomicrobiales bacterium]
MNIATILGLILGVAALVVGYLMEGGALASLFAPTALIIVFGGTIATTLVSYPLNAVLKLPKLALLTVISPKHRTEEIIALFLKLSDLARRDGLLALETEAQNIEDPFIQKGVNLVIDGTDSEVVEEILMNDIASMEERHRVNYKVFESMGGYAPTMGVLGTVMGMVVVLSNLAEPEHLGHSIAVAFLATLYGVGSANLIYLPLASKLKLQSEHEAMERRMIVQGILAIQRGDNPAIVGEQLTSFLSSAQAKRRRDADLPQAA